MRRHVFVLLFGVLAACGDDGAASEMTVTIKASGSALLAVQPAGGDWQPVQIPADGNAVVTLPETGFAIATVCDKPASGGQPAFFNYYTILSGPGADEIDLRCSAAALANPVTITAAPSTTAQIYVGYQQLQNPGALEIEAGTYDLVAFDDSTTPPRYEIRRAVSLTTDTELAFDLAATGAPLEPVMVTAANARPDESLFSFATLVTSNAYAYFFSPTAADGAWRVPPSTLQTGEYQLVQLSASTPTRAGRSVARIASSDPAMQLTLPEGLGTVNVTWDRAARVTWDSSATWERGYFGANSSDFTKLWDVLVHREWSDAMGPLTEIVMPDPAEVPGWRAEWNVVDRSGWDWSVSAGRAIGEREGDGAFQDGMF